jgi:tripartite-type tricarboxylate transporter receptor subunit TctC
MCVIARRALAVVLLAIASIAVAWAQGYPDRPLRLVVGFPPGGSGDFLARIIADELTREIGQPVVVDNRPGAASNIAAEHVAHAAPDGYTILLAGNFSHAINPWLYKLSWDPHRDFTPITEVALMSIIVCVAPGRGIRSMKELIVKVKSEPGKWFYASPGNGTSQHLAGAELNRLAGIDMQHVPFKGGAPSLQAVLAGDVQVMIGTTPVVLPQIRAGKLVPLALITRAASPMVPGVPGMEEAGVPGLDLGSWWGIWAPPGLRPEVKQRLYTSVTKVMRLPQVAEKLAREAMEPEISASPEEFAAFVRKDHASYEAIVKASGAKAE